MRLLRRMGFHYSPQCGCQDVVLRMNLGGVEWCIEHTAEIIAAMQRGQADPLANPWSLPWSEVLARLLLSRALKALE